MPDTVPPLIHPVFWISITLHGAFLLLPIADGTVTSTEKPPAPEETIALSDLLAPPTRGDRPPSAPLPSPSSAPPSPLVQPRVENPVQPPPLPPAVASPPSVSSTPTVEASPGEVEGAIASPSPTTTPEPSPKEPPDRVQTFFEELAAATGAPVNPPTPDLFADPRLFFDISGPESNLKPDILRAVWMDGKTPEQVYISVLSSQLQSGNFQTVQKPDYGGGTVYEVRQGDAVWYLNLVPTVDRNGTIIVVWNRDPSRPVTPHSVNEQEG